MPVGRPRAFNSPEEMQAKVDDYFENEDEPTMAGLCNHLGITKVTLHDYQKREDFTNLIKKARQRVEARVEQLLLYKNGGAGQIFWLKNHADYTDKTVQQHDVTPEAARFVMDLNGQSS